MIIDIHGHYTTAPPQHEEWRRRQLAGESVSPDGAVMTDDEIRATIEGTQLRMQRERGTDLTLFSPRAGGMAHHEGDIDKNKAWARVCNTLIHRVCTLFPQNFVPVCQLPQFPGAKPAEAIAELRRCVTELGFVGCNLNPDPSGGHWTEPPLTDPWWFPLYEVLEELQVPAMVHVSSSCNPNHHFTGAYYLNADTSAFMQLLESDLFRRFPGLRMVIPHGGGAVPYHWGRYCGMAIDRKLPSPAEMMGDNLFLDTCVYHQPGIDLLSNVVPVKNILFASELHGAVRCCNPETGHFFDDTRRYVEGSPHLSETDRTSIFSGNALRVYPQLSARMKGAGLLV